jgi:2-C-methyl-D-erythritol 4-phosphate cytidylyltransferase
VTAPRSAWGIVVAAGAGERLAAATPKALIDLGGQPLVVHAARALQEARLIVGLSVAAPPDAVAAVADTLDAAGIEATICLGGPTRHRSVLAGLESCPGGVALVAVHDAARPLVAASVVDRTVAAVEGPWVAAAPALPVVDTLKEADATGRVIRTVDRSRLWSVQTPQVFDRSALERALATADPSTDPTDELTVIEAAGGAVRLVEGDPRGFKITYPGDLLLAEALLAASEG